MKDKSNELILGTSNIILKRLSYENIELVRCWRNSGFVRQYMIYREYISVENQIKWFSNLDPKKNFFFIIYHNDYPVGMTEIKNIDWEGKIGDLGIFFATEEVLEIPLISFQAIVPLIEFGFNYLNLNALTATVIQSNIRALRFNQSLGFVVNHKDENGLFHIVLTQENFLASLQKLKRFLKVN